MRVQCFNYYSRDTHVNSSQECPCFKAQNTTSLRQASKQTNEQTNQQTNKQNTPKPTNKQTQQSHAPNIMKVEHAIFC